jgi:hypothetical protein
LPAATLTVQVVEPTTTAAATAAAAAALTDVLNTNSQQFSKITFVT